MSVDHLPNSRQFAVLLRHACHRKGWTLMRLSVESGVSRSTIERILLQVRPQTERRSPQFFPRFDTVSKLCHALDITAFTPPPPMRVLSGQEAQHG